MVVDEVNAELESCGFQCLHARIGGKVLRFSSVIRPEFSKEKEHSL